VGVDTEKADAVESSQGSLAHKTLGNATVVAFVHDLRAIENASGCMATVRRHGVNDRSAGLFVAYDQEGNGWTGDGLNGNMEVNNNFLDPVRHLSDPE